MTKASDNMTKPIPEEARSVLAEITAQADLGKQTWYEVVYHDGEDWQSYHDSETFSRAGDTVERWAYVDDLLSKTLCCKQ